MRRLPLLLARVRWILLAPVLAFLALSAWAFASPLGASPDDDYHLVSIWCAAWGSDECRPGEDATSRSMAPQFTDVTCYAEHRAESAACQTEVFNSSERFETDRGNFIGEYPPIYYAVMHVFAGPDIQVSGLVMRLVNVALFVGLATALSVLLPVRRRRTLLWGWLIAVIPLGMFIIASNNPSGWAVTGVGTAFLAALGWFETTGRRRWALGALYAVGVLMAAGSRGDAGVYVVGASLVAGIISFARTRDWLLRAILPVAGILVALAFFLSAGQSGVGVSGFTGNEAVTPPDDTGDAGVIGTEPDVALSGWALVAFNLLELPHLWSGVWGSWALGWFDTGLPSIVPWAGVAAFVAVGFAGLGRLDLRKSIAIAGVGLVLVVLPVYVLTVGGMKVGDALQPRYLLPLILLLCLLLVTMPPGRELRFTRVQTFVVLAALGVANLVALQVDIRRYVTGDDRQGLNLDAGAEWWWPAFPIGPMWVWVIGALAFAGLLAVIWPELRRADAAEELNPSSR